MPLPIANKKEVNGDLYYLKIAGLNSELSVKSADSPDSLIGEGIDYLIIDEAAAIKKIVWEQNLRPTLSDRNGWALMVSTPRGFNHFEKWYRNGQDDTYPDWDSWQHPSTESPYFNDDIEELKRTLTRETYLQEYESAFTSFRSFHSTGLFRYEVSDTTRIYPHTLALISGIDSPELSSVRSISANLRISLTYIR